MYFEKVIKELLWCYFFVYVVGCFLIEDIIIGGYFIFKDIVMILFIDLLQCIFKYWLNFDDFDFVRFDEEGKS